MYLLHVLNMIIIVTSYWNQCTAYSCLDHDGSPIDWFVLFKNPDSFSYSFFTSKNPGKWVSSADTDMRSNGPAFTTLEQTYRASARSSGVVVAMYNDESPAGSSASSSGHMKGVVTYNTSGTGFWLVHSVPLYPPADRYEYPNSGKEYGQMFLCLSTSSSTLNDIGYQLYLAQPNIYSLKVDTNFLETSTYWKFLKNKKRHPSDFPASSVKNIVSSAGLQFKHFAKDAKFNKDLYADLVAPYFNSNLLVETWDRGSGHPLNSSCGKYKVEMIRSVYALPSKTVYSYLNDHSKWVIGNGVTVNVNLLCVGDINRMESQFKRGGGTLCFFNSAAYRNMRDLIHTAESCKLGGRALRINLEPIAMNHVFHPYHNPYFVHYFPAYHIRIRVFYWMLCTVILTLLIVSIFAVALQVRRRRETIYYRKL